MRRIGRWLRRAQAQLDAWGRPGWIAAMVLGFILFWPIGLFILFHMIRSDRMASAHHPKRRFFGGDTGNVAFDEYRRETLRRLEEEREAFTNFLAGLREAKDRAEFEQFMDERKRVPAT